MNYALNFFPNSITSSENSEEPDQLVSDEASWSESTLFQPNHDFFSYNEIQS